MSKHISTKASSFRVRYRPGCVSASHLRAAMDGDDSRACISAQNLPLRQPLARIFSCGKFEINHAKPPQSRMISHIARKGIIMDHAIVFELMEKGLELFVADMFHNRSDVCLLYTSDAADE